MSEKWRPAAAVNDCGGRATERQKEEMERRERQIEKSCVKSISTPSGDGTNYCLIRRAEASLPALSH